jgi:hypothetical protein
LQQIVPDRVAARWGPRIFNAWMHRTKPLHGKEDQAVDGGSTVPS